jgi:hypothetical protein
VLGHVALDEQGAQLGIEPGGQQVDGRVPGPGAQYLGLDIQGQGVQVDDAVVGLVGVLIGHPVAHRTQIVPQMELAARLDTGKNPGHGGLS